MKGFAFDVPGGVRYLGLPGTVSDYGGRGVEGTAYGSRDGHLFRDDSGERWWVIFRRSTDVVPSRALIHGDVLACSAAHDEQVRVKELAADVLQTDADAAFREAAPSSFEEAAGLASLAAGKKGSWPR